MNKRDFRPRSITVLGELMTTRRTWPIMDATIASNGSIATPALVSQRRELFWCVEITVLGQIGVGRSLSSGDNIRCLDRQRSDLTVRWHLVGDRRAGDEPDTDIITRATETSGFRSSWAPDLGPRNV